MELFGIGRNKSYIQEQCEKQRSFHILQLWRCFNPLPDDNILDRLKLKQIAENIMRKEDTACYKQFLLFLQCIPLLYIYSVSKLGTVW